MAQLGRPAKPTDPVAVLRSEHLALANTLSRLRQQCDKIIDSNDRLIDKAGAPAAQQLEILAGNATLMATIVRSLDSVGKLLAAGAGTAPAADLSAVKEELLR
jgi:hypothetical protein